MVVAFADDRLIGRLVRFAWDPLGYVGVSDSCNRRVIGSVFDGLTKKSFHFVVIDMLRRQRIVVNKMTARSEIAACGWSRAQRRLSAAGSHFINDNSLTSQPIDDDE